MLTGGHARVYTGIGTILYFHILITCETNLQSDGSSMMRTVVLFIAPVMAGCAATIDNVKLSLYSKMLSSNTVIYLHCMLL